MLSKSQFQLINSLNQKKYRRKHQLFTVEGKKAIAELLQFGFPLHSLYTTQPIFEAAPERTFHISEGELRKISRLTTTQIALAVFEIPAPLRPEDSGLILALDGVRDPGNLGTIIRLCDWFGIRHLVCSEDTVDCYNSKVVQATMGSIARVNIIYTDLLEYLGNSRKKLAVFGAFMEGGNVYTRELAQEGILVMGNEANGITPEIAAMIDQEIAIPQFSGGREAQTESLNVATATAILLGEFRRRELTGK